MVKNLREGDEITLRFTVRDVWEDGRVSITHPLYSIPITISSNEIPEEDVTHKGAKKAPKPEQRMRHDVMVDQHAILSTEDRDEADRMVENIEGAPVVETPMKPKPRKKR